MVQARSIVVYIGAKNRRESMWKRQSGEVLVFAVFITKGDGVEFRRFFFHLFVVMKPHATSSQNRYAGCLVAYESEIGDVRSERA